MKILFLQLWYDLYGGIETVNDTLAGQFTKDGLEVSILCLWEKGQNEYVHAHDYQKMVIDKEPVRASYKQMFKNLLHFKFGTFFKDVKKSLNYYQIKKQNKKNFSDNIKNINPDFIIVSNPELISLVPDKYLKNTVIHMHTGMQFYEQDKKLTKLVLKYNDRVNRIIWLTPNFERESKKIGFTKGTYMSNPVRIKNDDQNNLENKTITFVGRICEVKRVDLLSEIFNQTALAAKGWTLKIYGTGDCTKIKKHQNVMLMGGTDNVQAVLSDSSISALTSAYEGFPMVILESYECGVPVIVFDYGVSAGELVIDGETGYIIPVDDMDLYVEKLKYLAENVDERIRLGNNAKEFVKKYYPENVAQRWYKLFRGEL